MLQLRNEKGCTESAVRMLCLFLACGPVAACGILPGRGIADEIFESPISSEKLDQENKPPLVWIVCGHPGDEAHDSLFIDVIRRLRETLHGRLQVSYEDIHVLYGREEPPYGSLCSRESLKSSLQAIARQAEQDPRDIWVFLLGHANTLEGDVFYNLPGDDLTGRELGACLQVEEAAGRLAIVLTTAAAGRFAPYLAGPKRAILSATEPADPDNRTEFPLALVEALQDDTTDANQDGWVDLLEIFRATRKRIDQIYKSRGWVKVEEATLDGDGDGRATRRPSFPDATGASTFRIKWTRQRMIEPAPPRNSESSQKDQKDPEGQAR